MIVSISRSRPFRRLRALWRALDAFAVSASGRALGRAVAANADAFMRAFSIASIVVAVLYFAIRVLPDLPEVVKLATRAAG